MAKQRKTTQKPSAKPGPGLMPRRLRSSPDTPPDSDLITRGQRSTVPKRTPPPSPEGSIAEPTTATLNE